MGVNVSKNRKISSTPIEKQRHKEVEQFLAEEQQKSMDVVKLLFLGAGDSGKSTIIKQMRILHNNGFNQDEIIQQCAIICENIVTSICAILRAMNEFDIQFGCLEREADAIQILGIENRPQRKLNFSEWTCLQRLWNDEGVQNCFKRSNEFQLADSTKYFCDDIERISASDYVPNDQDMLRTRVATIGTVEMFFTLRGLTLNVIDVGGQRSQRKKWIHCFDNVNALIYVASLSEYNQVLFEDTTQNRMIESLKLFSSIVNAKWFKKASILLFLNKKDIFKEKLQLYPISDLFTDYKGRFNDYEQASEYIKNAYENLRNDPTQLIYAHKTCATDTKNVEFVLQACFDMILHKSFQTTGLM